MKRRHGAGRLAAAVLSAIMLAAVLAAPGYAAATKEDLEQNVDQARQEYGAAQDELDQMEQDRDETQGRIDELGGKISQVKAQAGQVQASLDQTRTQLAEAQQQLAEAEADLAAKQEEHDRTWEDTKGLMNAMQQMHDGGGIALLSQATNLYELLTFSNVLDEMNDKCQSMLAQLQAEEEELSAKRQEAADAATALETAQATLQDQQSQLESLESQLSEALQAQNASLSQQEADLQAQQTLTDELKKKLDEAEAELDAYVRQQSENYTPPDMHCSLDFICPLDSYTYISTYFNGSDPWGRTHNGTDFAAPGGTPIRAAADGVVSVARVSSSYGNYVQVSHGADDSGNTYDTLYAHMQNYVVGVGQQVSKGELIGYVGNTGRVYGQNGGYHLHLELRVNSGRVDPLAYIPG